MWEHIQYLGTGGHVPPARVAGLEDRAVTINSLSKTYAVTGWRVGWVIATAELTGAIRKVHDFVTVGAAAPLQEAGVAAMELPAEYYERRRGRTGSGGTCCAGRWTRRASSR